MDFKKMIQEYGLANFPVGVGGCKISDNSFDCCVNDVVVFDEKSELPKLVEFENEFVMLYHASLSETNTKKLIQYDNLQIIQDESWDLRMFLSKINEKRESLFSDFAKNSLIESLFCCQKTRDSIDSSDVFAPCWQKCASFYLANA